MSGFDYSNSFRGINGALANLGKQNETAWLLQRQAEAGQDILAGNLSGAASKLTALGDIGGASTLIQLQQKNDERRLGQEATTALGSALRGLGGGSAFSPVSSGDSPLPATLISNESGGNWQAQNNEVGAGGARGHFGRGQFGVARIQEAANAGAIPQGTTPEEFMNSPELQQRAERWHVADIDQNIRANGFDRLVGQRINGVPITIDGLRAVAHLGGVNGMKKFVETQGGYNPSDANGTSLFDYFSRHGGQRTAEADLPAQGGTPVSLETGEEGFAIPPGGGSMSGQTLQQIARGLDNPPLRPAFEAEGLGQPWMGSALAQPTPANLGRPVANESPQARTAQAIPPRRPYDLNEADLPARGAVPAMGQMQAPAAARYADVDPNSPDGGARAFQLQEAQRSQGQGFAVPATATASARPAPVGGDWTSAPVSAGSSATAAAASETQGPVLTKDMPKPTNKEEALEYRATKDMENKRRQAGALAAALANPNLPANAREIGQIFLKDALEQSKMPESAKEFMYARGMGWTEAKNLAEYNAEKEKAKKNTADDDVQARQAAAARAGLKPGDAGYQGYILTGKMPREDMGPLTATDKKAILEADEAVQSAQTAIQALRDAKKLSPQALSGWGAGQKAALANNLPDWMVPDRFVASPQQGEATANLDNLVTSQALAQLKSIFGAAPTEGERKILLDIQGSVSQPENVRQQIYDRAIQMAERRLAFNQQRASELRGGDFYKSPEKRGQGGGQPSPQGQAQPQQGSAPMQGAKQAPDGNWYVPDPNRLGKFLRVN